MATRKAVRRAVKTQVKLYSETFGEFSGTSRNISDSGIFIDIEPFIGLQSEKENKLVFLNSANKRVVFNVEFIRDTEKGVAFKFIDFETGGHRYQLSELRSMWEIHKAAKHVAA